ncbi:MAG: sigma-70 family RNA polymerase sigma factor [Planctomycetia bacterium]|nr:sigma-70 family RNA polymerase sigma factor [Planctomycetia bacterium]
MPSDKPDDLVNVFLPMLLKRARRVLKDQALAEDVVNDVFTSVLANPNLKMGDPKRFMRRAVTYACLDQNKKERRETALLKEYRVWQAPPELEAMREELEKVFDQLPPEQQEVLELGVNLTMAEVAEELDIPQSTAESRFRHAREAARELLTKSQEKEK